jgi:hypothetical protein
MMRWTVPTIVVEAVSKLSLFTLAVALVDVAASVAVAPVLIEVGTQVDAWRGVRPWLVDFFLDSGNLAMRRSIGSTTRMPARRR